LTLADIHYIDIFDIVNRSIRYLEGYMVITDKEVGARFKLLRSRLNLGQKELATVIGTGQSVVSDIERGVIGPSRSVLSILSSSYSANLHWLLTGEGLMFIGAPDVTNELPTRELVSYLPEDDERAVEQYRLNGKNSVEMAILKIDPDIAFVDFYPQTIGAGPGHEAEAYLEVTRLPVMRKFLAPWRPEQIRALEARGDSMTKIGLFDRDIVLYVPEETEGDGVFVISIENRLQVKRIEFDLLGEALKIISENERYEPRVLMGPTEVERVKIEGKVVGWLHRHPY